MSGKTDASVSDPIAEPISYDSMGAPIYRWQVSELLDESVRARLKQMIDDNQA
jgi:hypothetical protein